MKKLLFLLTTILTASAADPKIGGVSLLPRSDFNTNNAALLAAMGPSGSTPTNFVLNTVYTNKQNTTILVEGVAGLVGAAVSGASSLDLMVAPSNTTAFVKVACASMTTVITGFAIQVTNSVSHMVTNGASYYWTNSSSGAGNSAALVSGTGQYTPIGGGVAGPTGATGATGSIGNDGSSLTNFQYGMQTFPGACNAQVTLAANTAGWTTLSGVTTLSTDTLTRGVLGKAGTVSNMWISVTSGSATAFASPTTNFIARIYTNGMAANIAPVASGNGSSEITGADTANSFYFAGATNKVSIMFSNQSGNSLSVRVSWGFTVYQ